MQRYPVRPIAPGNEISIGDLRRSFIRRRLRVTDAVADAICELVFGNMPDAGRIVERPGVRR